MGKIYNSQEEYLKSKGGKAPEVTVGQPEVSVESAGNPMYNSQEEYDNAKNSTETIDRNSEFDFDAGNMVGNLGPSFKKEGAEILNALTSPLETGESIFNMVWGGVQKLDPTGVLGTNKEKYAEAVADYYAEKYGSFNAFKRELENNPAGVLGDASMVITGGAGLVKLGAKAGAVGNIVSRGADAVGKVGASIDPINLALNVPLAGAGKLINGSPIKDTLAPSLYEASLKPNPRALKSKRDRAVKTGLNEKLPVNRKSQLYISDTLSDLGKKVDDIIESSDASISVDKLFETFDTLLKEYDVIGDIDTKGSLAEIAKLRDRFEVSLKKKRNLSASQLQKLKKRYASRADYNQLKSQGTQVEDAFYKEMAGNIRTSISDTIPAVKAGNARMTDLFNLDEFLSPRVGVVGNSSGGSGQIGRALASQSQGGIQGVSNSAGALIGEFVNTGRARAGILLNEYRNNPISALLDNGSKRPFITNLLGNTDEMNNSDYRTNSPYTQPTLRFRDYNPNLGTPESINDKSKAFHPLHTGNIEDIFTDEEYNKLTDLFGGR